MSGGGAGGTGPPPDPGISEAELARLVKLLGMLGSAHDGEVVNAARLAVRWVAEQRTSWAALLEPPADVGVVSVGVGVGSGGVDAGVAALLVKHRLELDQAYRNGFNEAMAEAQRVAARAAQAQASAARAAQAQASAARAAQAQAQASAARAAAAAARAAQARTANAQTPGPGQGQGGAGAAAGAGGAGAAAGAAGAAGAAAGGSGPVMSWQAVAQEILDQHQNCLRGSRELDFVSSLLVRGWASLTPAQDGWLRDIAARAGLSWP